MGRYIIVVGYMGSGKTTVSRGLERKYGFRRLEMDALIEEKAHMSISEIFRTQGEQGFRRMETDLLLKIAKKKSDADPDTVLSAGGGTVLREENRKLLKEIGEVIYLRITPEEVIARLGNDRSRPMLNAPGEKVRPLQEHRAEQLRALGFRVYVADGVEQIREMMEYREPMYRDAADREIDAGHRKPEEIAEEILKTV